MRRKKLDLEMLAYDIAELLSGDEYDIDVDAHDVLTELPTFVRKM
jgi:hypothetical protein